MDNEDKGTTPNVDTESEIAVKTINEEDEGDT